MVFFPEVAIIIPTYHESRLGYIQEAVSSVLKQCFENYLLVICDDNPGRDKVSDLHDIIKLDERVKYISYGKNLGIAGSRNRGIQTILREHPSVKYIGLLDDDDGYLREDKLREQVHIMNHDANIGIVGTNGKIMSHDSTCVKDMIFPQLDQDIRKKINFAFPFMPSSLLIRREIFHTLSLNESLLGCDDYLLVYQILRHYSGYTLQEDMTRYRIHENNTCFSLGNIKTLSYEKLSIIKEHGKDFPYYYLGLGTNALLYYGGPHVKLFVKKIFL